MVWPFGKGKNKQAVEAVPERGAAAEVPVPGAWDAELQEVFEALLDQSGSLGSSGYVKGFLLSRSVTEQALADWLGRQAGLALTREQRGELRRLAGLVRGGLGAALGAVAGPEEVKEEQGPRERLEEPSNAEADGVEALINRAIQAFQTGDYQGAVKFVELATQQYPKSDRAWLTKGELMVVFQEHEAAIASYDKALAIQPDDHQAWSNRGISLQALGQLDDAIASYDKALAIKSDDHDAWNNRGISLQALGQLDDAIASYDKALAIQPDFHQAWYNRGSSLDDLGRLDDAIASYDKALAIKPDFHQAWYNRGVSLKALGRVDDAIASYDKALAIKPDFHQAWYNRGISLKALGRLDDAIASYDKALAIKPDFHQAWYNRGVSLKALGRVDDAIASYDKALAIQPDDHQAWSNRGLSLQALGRVDDAIASYDKALAIQPDKHEAWNNRGISLHALGRLDDAIASYDKALAIQPDKHEAWANRSIAIAKAPGYEPFSAAQRLQFGFTQPSPELLAQLAQPPAAITLALTTCGDPGAIQTLTAGLTHCPAPTYGHGFLQRELGHAHWNHAKTQPSPSPLWRAARDAYNTALKILTATDHPQDHLKTLQGLIRTHLALGDLNDASLTALLRQGSALRQRLLDEATSDEQRQRRDIELPNFNQLTVDHLLRQGNFSAALTTAEADKNALMQWLLASAGATTLDIDLSQIQQQLPAHRAILYWHHSPNALTTFLLLPGEPQPRAIFQSDAIASIQQVTQLEAWIKTWNTRYQDLLAKTKGSSNKVEATDWYQQLPTALEQLATLLNLAHLKAQLPSSITQLTLIPHRDLHRFPLHHAFPEYQTTSLPSLQLGQLLRPSLDWPIDLSTAPGGISSRTNGGSSLRDWPTALNIDAPNHDGLDPLHHAEAETALIAQLLSPSHRISTIPAHEATATAVQQALAQPHSILHFNGHAYHDFNDPKQSALALNGSDRLTVQDLLQLSLNSYSLISLASCETALSGNQTINSEYVGLTSALLAKGIPHILSTLWTVESIASMVFIVEFYSHLHLGPAAAYHHSRQTLPRLSISDLRSRYKQWLKLELPTPVRELLTEELEDLNPTDTIDPRSCPYSHPYYWSAFVLTGAAA